VGIGLGLLMGWFGIGSLQTFRRHRKEVQASQYWQKGKARVFYTNCDVEIYYHEGGQSFSYIPRVQYIYHVDGQVYQGQRLKFGQPNYGCLNKPEEILAKYPSGRDVSVYYNPLHPEDSVLERVAFVPMVYLILGSILSALMLIILGLMAYCWIFEKQAVLSFFNCG
jgi:hypothetical protein